MRVTLLVPSGVKDSLVSRICAEAEAIWEPAGVIFEWHRATGQDIAPSQLDVTIDDRPRRNLEWRAALGSIRFTAGSPEPSIHLSLAAAEELLLGTTGVDNATIVAHETLVGRALGRALSHELGHYLLKSATHTHRGLMRATWPSDEFFGVRRNGFELTSDERRLAWRAVFHAG